MTWYDGTVRCYSAKDGSLLSQTRITPPDRSLSEIFVTDRYRISSLPQSPAQVYDKMTGERLGQLPGDANLAYVTQAGRFLVADYFTTADGARYSLLLNDSLEVLATLPHLCDIEGDELLFDIGQGSLRSCNLLSLPELLKLSDAQLEQP